MRPTPAGGHVALAGTVMSCVALPVEFTSVSTTNNETIGRPKLIILHADHNVDGDSKRNYPDDQWNQYCEWVRDKMTFQRTRFLVSSQFWTPTKDQHAHLLETARMERRDRKYYLSSVVGSSSNVGPVARGIHKLVAAICTVKDGAPLKFFFDNDLQGALQYMQISERHLCDVEDTIEDLQRAIDKRNGKFVQQASM